MEICLFVNHRRQLWGKVVKYFLKIRAPQPDTDTIYYTRYTPFSLESIEGVFPGGQK